MNRSGPDPLPALAGDGPLVVMVSACLLGQPVGYDGSSWPSELVAQIAAHPRVRAVPFCPEHFALGTPRRWMTIHGGDGFAVLDGQARVINVDGEDLSEPFRLGAAELTERSRAANAQLAILTDVSPMCGSAVIYAGEQLPERRYAASSGVGAAALRRRGLPVISQRDTRSLLRLLAILNDEDPAGIDARDFIEDPWYVQTLGAPAPPGPEPVWEE